MSQLFFSKGIGGLEEPWGLLGGPWGLGMLGGPLGLVGAWGPWGAWGALSAPASHSLKLQEQANKAAAVYHCSNTLIQQ